jgi:hypothetical protein
MDQRFKSLYGKPRTLSDPYDELDAKTHARLLKKPEQELEWCDFRTLYLVGVAPASYEEGVYYLPEAFACLCRKPNTNAVDCVSEIVWFISEHAARLEKDGLLSDCQAQLSSLVRERLRQFVVVHWDREKNRQMGFDREYKDYVEDCQLVCATLEPLLRFKTLAHWAREFVDTLKCAEDDALKSAWFLTLVRESSTWLFLTPIGKPTARRVRIEEKLKEVEENFLTHAIRGSIAKAQQRLSYVCPPELAADHAVLNYHADVVRESGALFASNPTYWRDLFQELGLEGN